MPTPQTAKTDSRTTDLQCRVHIFTDQPCELLAGWHGTGHQVEQRPRVRSATAVGVAAGLLYKLHVQLVPQLLALQALRHSTAQDSTSASILKPQVILQS